MLEKVQIDFGEHDRPDISDVRLGVTKFGVQNGITLYSISKLE
jgi:hypothetical protein